MTAFKPKQKFGVYKPQVQYNFAKQNKQQQKN